MNKILTTLILLFIINIGFAQYVDFVYKPNINLELLVVEQEVKNDRLKKYLNNEILEAKDRWESYIIDEEYNSMIVEKGNFVKIARISEEIFSKDIAPLLYYYTSLAYLGKYNKTGNESNLSEASNYAIKSKSYGLDVNSLLKKIKETKQRKYSN